MSGASERAVFEDSIVSPRPGMMTKRVTVASIQLSASAGSAPISSCDDDLPIAQSPQRSPHHLLRKGMTDIGLHKPGWRTSIALVATGRRPSETSVDSCSSISSSGTSRAVSTQLSGFDDNAVGGLSQSIDFSQSMSWSLSSVARNEDSSDESSEGQVTIETLRDLVDARPSLRHLNLSEFISDDCIELQSDEFDRTVLGAGGQGRIFLATLRPSGLKVAVKVSNRESVLQEYIMAQKLRHPNLLKPIGFSVARLSGLINNKIDGSDDEWVNMAIYEYCRYGDLVSFLEKHPKMATDPTFLHRAFSNVLSALQHLHTQGYVHCDIKPGNILVADNYEVKLGDLGMCQQLSEAMNAQGTPSYLAPEVVLAWSGSPRSHSFTDRIDVFSLGVTMVHVIAGEYPFDRITARLKSKLPFTAQECEQHFSISQKCLAKLNQLDPSYSLFATKCLHLDAAQRPSASELLHGLKVPTVA